MKMKELRKKSPAELTKELSQIELTLLRLKAQVAAGSAGKDAGKIRAHKRTIAQIKTLQGSGRKKTTQ
jgi:ribosomal protein L29